VSVFPRKPLGATGTLAPIDVAVGDGSSAGADLPEAINFQTVYLLTPDLIDTVWLVEKSARVELRNSPVADYWVENSGVAAADPIFSFDQDEFDRLQAEAGLASFQLEDYYDFVYTEGIETAAGPAAVPLGHPIVLYTLLPGALMGLALASLQHSTPKAQRR
jgi:hypothetical protein